MGGGRMAPEEEVIQVEKKPKRSKKGLIIAVAGLFVVLLFLLGGIWFALRTGVLGDLMAGMGKGRTSTGSAAQAEKAPDYMYEMPEILVNLNDGGLRSRFLSIKFNIGYDNAKLEPQLEQRMPEIRDKVNSVLWRVCSEDILTLEGKERLREDLHQTIDEMFYEYEIRGIYFWHLMIQ